MAENYGADPLFGPSVRNQSALWDWIKSHFPRTMSDAEIQQQIASNGGSFGPGGFVTQQPIPTGRPPIHGPAYPPLNMMPPPSGPGFGQGPFANRGPAGPQATQPPASPSAVPNWLTSTGVGMSPPASAPAVPNWLTSTGVGMSPPPSTTPSVPNWLTSTGVGMSPPEQQQQQQQATPKPKINPAAVDLGYYRGSVGNARTPVFVPQSQTQAPQIFRGPLAVGGPGNPYYGT